MISKKLYPYGATIAAALVGGVVAYYMSTDPGPLVHADDFVELAEAVNERYAALSDDGFSYAGNTNQWGFTVFNNQLYAPTMSAMSNIMKHVVLLAPQFVREADGTNITYWTAPALFAECGIGPADGTQALFTVGHTSGAPVYGSAPGLHPITNTLWECYRALSIMTTTVRRASGAANKSIPLVGAVSNYSWRVELDDSVGSVVPQPGPPGGDGVNDFLDAYLTYDISTATWDFVEGAAGYAGESYAAVDNEEAVFSLTTVTDTSAVPPAVTSETNQYNYQHYMAAEKNDADYIFRIQPYASGTVASAQMIYYITGNWSVKGFGEAAYNQTINAWTCSAPVDVFFSNSVATGWHTTFTNRLGLSMTDYAPPARWSRSAPFIFSSYSASSNDFQVAETWVWRVPENEYEMSGSVIEDGTERRVVIRWQFLYCRPPAP